MAKIATLPNPDKKELHEAQKQEKREARTKARKEKLDKRDNLLQSIPPLPEYQPMPIEYRAAVSHLPIDILLTPYTIFSLIWTSTVWNMFCINTNLYAAAQSSPQDNWKPTEVPELKIFIAITIYIGIYRFPIIHDYWRTDSIASVPEILRGKMPRDRYVLLRKFLHCSDPAAEDSFTIGTGRHKQPIWYKKLMPFADEIRSN